MGDAANYPADADGDALRRVAGDGSDMARPMAIDFSIEVPDEESGRYVAHAAAELGYRSRVYQDGESKGWTCYCTKVMIASYPGVVAAQLELEEIASLFGGHCDGWGTFGNVRAE